MKILLTGSEGQLGKSVIKYFNTFIKSNSIDLLQTTRKELDLIDVEKCTYFIKQTKPDFVLNTAAYTAVDKAEDEYLIAKKVNSDALAVISDLLKNSGGKLIHVSTDYVFDGNQEFPYRVDRPRNPINSYGRTKAEGEKNIEEILFKTNQGFILRTSWLLSPIGKNFALTMLDLMNKKEEIKVVSDQIGSPTSTFSLARICWEIIFKLNSKKNIPNIMHWSDAGIASWYDIALAIGEIGRKIGLLEKIPNLIPIMTSEFKTAAKRPMYSVLDCKDTENNLNVKQTYWRKTLEELLLIREQYISGDYVI